MRETTKITWFSLYFISSNLIISRRHILLQRGEIGRIKKKMIEGQVRRNQEGKNEREEVKRWKKPSKAGEKERTMRKKKENTRKRGKYEKVKK